MVDWNMPRVQVQLVINYQIKNNLEKRETFYKNLIGRVHLFFKFRVARVVQGGFGETQHFAVISIFFAARIART